MKFSLVKIIFILFCFEFTTLQISSMQAKIKKSKSNIFDTNYSHFAESILNPNYKEDGDVNIVDHSMNYMDLIGVFNSNTNYNHFTQNIVTKTQPQEDNSIIRQRQKSNIPVLRAMLLKQKFDDQNKAKQNVIPKKLSKNENFKTKWNQQEVSHNLRRVPINKKEDVLSDSDLENDLGDIDI